MKVVSHCTCGTGAALRSSVFEEVTQQKLKLVEAKELLQESDYNARSVLNHTKGQCSDLKMTWLELQTRAKILEYLERGRGSWPELGAVDVEVKDAKKKASGMKKEAAQQEKLLSELAQQANTTYKVLSQLSGVEEHSVVGKSLTVKLVPPPDSSCNVIPLLTLHFREQLTGGFTLEGAVVDPPSLEIEDLVEVAMETNDTLFFVNRVRERFFTQMPLLQEIEGLRHRFAIDYEAVQKRVRVMLGEGGRITCTLDIGRDYPGAGGVQLVDCTGIPEGKTLQELLPSTTHLITLEQWLEHLTTVCSEW
uniref:Uncharacterized protein n=1 Tax=Branchiostoma floridae TaxID=7739 RepID=C3YW70_BRAFL|eukprot:XP_002599512.1 hypothetical protein BRAFLDRAFT_122736 [Branchiostoma floridae]